MLAALGAAGGVEGSGMAADRCQRSTARRGKTLVFEDVACDWAPRRVRPDEDVLMRVVSGLILLTTDEAERLLEPGDEAIVPAGHCYRLEALSGTARTITGYRSPHS